MQVCTYDITSFKLKHLGREVLDDALAVDELLEEEAGDRDHGEAAVLEFLGRHLGEFLRVRGLEAGRVEADVARVVLVLETCVESKFQAPSVLNRCGDLHAIDATLARLRGGAGLSPLYGANGPIIAEK